MLMSEGTKNKTRSTNVTSGSRLNSLLQGDDDLKKDEPPSAAFSSFVLSLALSLALAFLKFLAFPDGVFVSVFVSGAGALLVRCWCAAGELL